jgi:hypothetical protein
MRDFWNRLKGWIRSSFVSHPFCLIAYGAGCFVAGAMVGLPL